MMLLFYLETLWSSSDTGLLVNDSSSKLCTSQQIRCGATCHAYQENLCCHVGADEAAIPPAGGDMGAAAH